MKITALRSFMSRDANRPRVIIAIDTDEGITGWGECYNHGPDRALPPLLDYYFDQIVGHDPTRVEFLYLKLLQHNRFPPGALGLAAMSAIDHALWDISAKALGVPVYQLLGGRCRDRVRVYSGVYTAPDPEIARDQLPTLNAAWGFTAFKLSPYRIDLHANRWGEVVRTSADYFRRLREVCPNDFEIAFDAHAKIFEPWQAAQLGNALAPYDPLFFEEPIRPEHIPAWGELKRQLTVPLATAVNVHFSVATPNFKILEYRLPTQRYMGTEDSDEGCYILDPYLPKDGYLELRPERPGWGVEMDLKYLASDRYIHWERKLPVRPDGSYAFM